MDKEKIVLVADSISCSGGSFLEIISGLLVPLIACFGAYIAYQQYKINKLRLRSETYERRLTVYKSVQRYLSEVMRDGKTSYQKALQFSSDASEAAFLFDSSVQDKIDLIYEKSIEMVSISEKLNPSDGSPGIPKGEERNILVNEVSDLTKWHIKELKSSREFFAKRLGLAIK